jgi:hypothetical protein
VRGSKRERKSARDRDIDVERAGERWRLKDEQ